MPSENPTHAFIPNALQVYGVHHFVHNLTADVHSACKYWDQYYEHLKVLSAILTVRERRRRVINFCIKPSRYASEAHKLDHFDAHLYTKRWREVTAFSKALAKIIWLFGETWNEAAYNAGRTQNDDEIDSAIGALNTRETTQTLANNFFRRYIQLVIVVDTLPEDHIAKFGSVCLCHGPLRAHKSQYMFSKCMEAHYGKGHKDCPAAGCVASEFAAGRILDAVFFGNSIDVLCRAVLGFAVLWCAVLRHAVTCCVVLCSLMLCCAALCCAVLFCAVLCYAVLRCVARCCAECCCACK